MNDATLASDNPLCFKNNLSGRVPRLTMVIDNKIKNQMKSYNMIQYNTIQYNTIQYREAAKISALTLKTWIPYRGRNIALWSK